MRISIFLVIICFFLTIPNLSFSQTDSDQKGWSGNVNFFLGAKILDDENWDPVDKHTEGGMFIDFKHSVLPFSIAIDFLYSRDDADISVDVSGYGIFDTKVEFETTELDFGVRKIWGILNNVHPFIGGGIAVIKAELKSKANENSVSDHDTGFGIWFDIGVYYTLNKRFNIGADVRWSKAKADLFDLDGDVGGWHYGVVVGVNW